MKRVSVSGGPWQRGTGAACSSQHNEWLLEHIFVPTDLLLLLPWSLVWDLFQSSILGGPPQLDMLLGLCSIEFSQGLTNSSITP